jgi:hypothetical protein
MARRSFFFHLVRETIEELARASSLRGGILRREAEEQFGGNGEDKAHCRGRHGGDQAHQEQDEAAGGVPAHQEGQEGHQEGEEGAAKEGR